MKKYLFMLSTALLCLGLVASCDKDDEKEKEMEKEEATQKYDNGTPKFLTGGWISEGTIRIDRADTLYRYYFLYVDERGEGSMGYDEFEERIEGKGVSVGSKTHDYRYFEYIRQGEDGVLKALMHSQTTPTATITSQTDSTLTLDRLFLYNGPMTLKKTEPLHMWR